MKYVYGARKLNETNADDRSEHDHASTVEFTRCDSFPIYHRDSTLFPPSLSLSIPPSKVSKDFIRSRVAGEGALIRA